MRKTSTKTFNQSISTLSWCILMILMTFPALAQPNMFKTVVGTSSTANLLNTNSRKSQQLYLPGDLTGTMNGNITKVYFRWAANTTGNYTNFSIKLGQTTNTTFTQNGSNYNFFTGLTTVFSSATHTINVSATAGDFVELPITLPFAYDATKTLIVEIAYQTVTSTSPNARSSSGPATPNQRAIYHSTDYQAAVSNNAGTVWPDMGFQVDAFSPNDAGVTDISVPSVTGIGSQPVQVTIRNYGTQTLTQAQVQWSVNGVAQAPFAWTGSLAPGAISTPFSIGNYNFSSLGRYSIIANTAMPNNVADDLPANDEFSKSVKACGPLAGNYTINSGQPTMGTNFVSVKDAVEFLSSCGVSAAVTITAEPGSGPFAGQLQIPVITGASSTNKVVLKGNHEIITHDGTVAGGISGRSTLILDGVQHITIDSFTINATGATTGWGIQLINGASNNSIINNFINTSLTGTTSGNTAGVVASGDYASYTTAGTGINNNTISNNTIKGGYIGIVLTGPAQSGNAITNNKVEDFYASAIQLTGNNGAVVSGNEISRPTRTNTTTVNAINLTGAVTASNIFSNKIFGLFQAQLSSTSTANLININNLTVANAAEGNSVYNNLIYDIRSSGSVVGVLQTASPYTKLYHNTIVFDDGSAGGTGTTRGYSQTTNADGIEFKNNIVYITRGGTGAKHAIVLATASSNVVSNNNVLFVNATAGHIGMQVSTNRTTLSDWQTNTSQDLNSVDADPMFTNPALSDFIPTSALVANKGANVGITTDIAGNPRTITAPDPGAYEWTAAGLDAAISWVAPAVPTTAGSKTITVKISNVQTTTINSVALQYTDGTTTVSQTFTSLNLTAGNNVDLSFTTPYQLDYPRQFTVRVLNVNGVNDDEPSNNEVSIYLCIPMSGTYTINKAIPTNLAPSVKNFASFADMATALNCGVSSDVVINVVPLSGPYDEQVIIPTIAGTGPTATVTLKGNNNLLQYQTVSASRHVLRLTDVSYFTVDSLFIGAIASTATTPFMGIHINNTGGNITIKNCVIDMTGITSSLAGGIVCSGSTTSNLTAGNFTNINILNDSTIGGGYGISFYGTNNSGIVISGNKVADYSSNGIYTRGTDGLQVSHNLVSKAGGSAGGNAIQLAQSDNINGAVFNNIITHELTAAATFRGIYVFGGTGHKVYNNVVRDIKAETGTAVTGISVRPATEVYFNTVVMDHSGSTTATVSAFAEDASNTGSTLRNNVFVVTQPGAGTKAAIAMNTSSTLTTALNSNFNVFWVGSGNVATRGTTTYQTLNQWTAASTQDSSSKEEDPMFVSTTLAKPTNANINNIGVAIPGISTDIEGTVRGVNPDPGAYEFVLPPCNTTPTPGNAVSSSVSLCAGDYFTLSLQGNSIGDLQTYQWQSSPDGVNGWTNISSPSSVTTLYTTQSVSTWYRAAVVCNGGSPAYSSAIQVVSALPVSGVFTINNAIPTGGQNFASFTEAINKLVCGTINGPVVFNVATSSGPYAEQVVIPQIAGMSATNTITINGNNANISFLSTNTAQRGVIKLDGADYVNINNLVIDVQGSASTEYGYGVHLLNDADNNTISGCTINVNTSSTGTNWAGIVINGAHNAAPTTAGTSLCDSNLLMNNTIIGGHTGIALTANGSTSQIHNNKVVGNIIRDFYTNGVHVNGNVNALIEGNNISRPNRSAVTDFRGVNMDGVSLATQISKNNIHDPFTANAAANNAAVGIRIANVDATTGNETVASNNIIYNFIGGTGTQNGVLVNNSDNTKFYHNSIALEDQSVSCNCAVRGIYVQNTNVTGVDIRNNIITIKRGGTGDKQAIFFEPTSVSAFTINHNIYYLDPVLAGLVEVARVGTTGYADMAAWQATGKDVNGVFSNPMFQDVANGNLTPSVSSLDNLGTPVGVTTDILNVARNATTPDIGAYEFGVPTPITGLVFSGYRSGDINRLLWTTRTEIMNAGFSIERSIDGRNFSAIGFVASKGDNGNSTNELSYSFDDAQPLAGSNFYRLRQQDKDGRVNYSNIVVVRVPLSKVVISNVYPNPAADRVKLTIHMPSAQKVAVHVTDVAGRIILTQLQLLDRGDSVLELDVSGLAQGTYFITLKMGGEEQHTRKFVK